MKRNKVTNTDIVRRISQRTNLSQRAVNLVLKEYATLIHDELILGNEVMFYNVCTFMLRRRKNNFATLPNLKRDSAKIVFYDAPYARMAAKLRNELKDKELHKETSNN